MKAILLLTSALAVPAASGFTYVESTSGDLSNTTTPTDLGNLELGANSVSGQLTNVSGLDPDVFTFTVPVGQQLTSLSFSSLTGNNHFFAFEEAASITSFTSASALSIAALVSSSQTGDNLLDTLSGGGDRGGSGVTAPLQAGNYSVWFQETNGLNVDYTISLTSEVVPEPSSALLLSLSGFALMRRRR